MACSVEMKGKAVTALVPVHLSLRLAFEADLHPSSAWRITSATKQLDYFQFEITLSICCSSISTEEDLA